MILDDCRRWCRIIVYIEFLFVISRISPLLTHRNESRHHFCLYFIGPLLPAHVEYNFQDSQQPKFHFRRKFFKIVERNSKYSFFIFPYSF